MTKTEGGQEQELVLGNKQLLSAFFIVVALLGVFFTMGYIIGRNTGRETPAATETAGTATPKPLEARTEKPVEARTVESAPPEEPSAGAAPAKSAPPAVATQPAKPYEDQPAGAVVAKPKVREEPPAPVEAGKHYLQVMAVKRPDAEKVQKILQGQSFPVTLRESSKEGLYRVLVGPYEDRPALSKAKDDLKNAGFDSIVAK